MSADEVETFLRSLGCCPAAGVKDRSLPESHRYEQVAGRRAAWRQVHGIVTQSVTGRTRHVVDRWLTSEVSEWATLRLAGAPAGCTPNAAAVAQVAQLHDLGLKDVERVLGRLVAFRLQPSFGSHLHAWLVHQAPRCRPLIERAFLVEGSPIDGSTLAACGKEAAPVAVLALEMRSQDRQDAAADAIRELARRGVRLTGAQLQAVHRVAMATTSESAFCALAAALKMHGETAPAWLRTPAGLVLAHASKVAAIGQERARAATGFEFYGKAAPRGAR